MTIPSLIEPTNEEKIFIPRLRQLFLTEVNKSEELFNSKDIDKIANNDWSVHRFLLSAKGDIEDGLNRMLTAMKWRKTFGVNDIKESDFPINYYKGLKFGKARDGSILVIAQSKHHLPISEWRELFKKFIIFMIEYLDNKNDGNGVTVLIDCSDSGYSNVDFNLALFLRPIHGKYFPKLIKLHLITEVPWIINSILWAMFSLLPEKTRKTIKIVNKEKLIEYIDEDQLPLNLEGNESKLHLFVANNAPNAEEVAERLGISTINLEKFLRHCQNFDII